MTKVNASVMVPDLPDEANCEVLFVCVRRNGRAKLSMRLQGFEWEGEQLYAARLDLDDHEAGVQCRINCPSYFRSLLEAVDTMKLEARAYCGSSYRMGGDLHSILRLKK